jgi:hypothetical protein
MSRPPRPRFTIAPLIIAVLLTGLGLVEQPARDVSARARAIGTNKAQDEPARLIITSPNRARLKFPAFVIGIELKNLAPHCGRRTSQITIDVSCRPATICLPSGVKQSESIQAHGDSIVWIFRLSRNRKMRMNPRAGGETVEK